MLASACLFLWSKVFALEYAFPCKIVCSNQIYIQSSLAESIRENIGLPKRVVRMMQYRLSKLNRFIAAGLLLASCSVIASAQKSEAPEPKREADARQTTSARQGAKAPEKAAFSVRLSKETPRTFTVKAREARLPDVTSEIGRLLKVPVHLSPLMEKQRITIEFSGLNLEATLRMLAPHPYVDYEVGGTEHIEPKPLAVYLHALNERPPSPSEAVKSNSEAVLIEGDTEEGTDAYEERRKKEEDTLSVSYAKNQLSVRARKQPLTVVLYKIASEVGIPFELRYESPEVVDMEFNNYSLEQAVRTLSSSVRLYYRADLQTFEIQPLRLAVVAPASAKY